MSDAGATPSHAKYWRQNMYVCLFGSFTTIMAMTLLLPFLPLYVAELGVKSPSAVVQWSGIAYGITFLGAGIMAPVWGMVADRYGRKVILMRASLGMAISMSLIGVAGNVWQLVALRLLAGFLGGYSSGAIVLVATQTPKTHSGWALGTLSTGVMAGTLLGPLVGGVLPGLIGVRETFFLAGGVIFIAFIATSTLIREDNALGRGKRKVVRRAWASIPDRRPVIAMLVTATMLMIANMSIEPIITVYVGTLRSGSDVVLMAGVVMAVSAFGSILAAPQAGPAGRSDRHLAGDRALSAGHRGAADPAGFRDECLGIGRAALPDGHVARRADAQHQRDHPPQRAGCGGGHHTGLRDLRAICRPGDRSGGGRFRRRSFGHACRVPVDDGADLRRRVV